MPPFNTPPDDGANEKQWFAFFRMTAYFPAMASKYAQCEIAKKSSGAAHRIQTAYLAAAVDCCMHIDLAPRDFMDHLGRDLKISPHDFLTVSVEDISRITGRALHLVREALTDAGLKLDGHTVTGYAPPPGKNPPRIRPKQGF